MTPEGKVKKEIKAWLDTQDCYYFMPVQSGYGVRTVDILLCWAGHFFAVEVKAPGGKAAAFQERVLRRVRETGGYAVCVDSVTGLQGFISALSLS
jgi:hypothetical protein